MPRVTYFLFNFVCPKIILHEYFLDEILLDEKKANYGSCSVAILLFAAHYNILVYMLNVHHTINDVDKYYSFPSHCCVNMCSAGDNYADAETVDTRPLPTKSLGTRLATHQHIFNSTKCPLLQRGCLIKCPLLSSTNSHVLPCLYICCWKQPGLLLCCTYSLKKVV